MIHKIEIMNMPLFRDSPRIYIGVDYRCFLLLSGLDTRMNRLLYAFLIIGLSLLGSYGGVDAKVIRVNETG